MALPAEEIRYTFADVLTWNEGDRIEIIDGEAFMMSPPLTDHQRICGGLFAQLYNYLKDKSCEVFPAPFGVRLFERGGDAPEDVDTMVEPDITVVCDKSKLDGKRCNGAPDFIIEIVSPGNPADDYIRKLYYYQKAGVREYWIVDPRRRMVTVNCFQENLLNIQYSFDSAVRVGIFDDLIIDFRDLARLLDI